MFNTSLTMKDLENMSEKELYECFAAYEEMKKQENEDLKLCIMKSNADLVNAIFKG